MTAVLMPRFDARNSRKASDELPSAKITRMLKKYENLPPSVLNSRKFRILFFSILPSFMVSLFPPFVAFVSRLFFWPFIFLVTSFTPNIIISIAIIPGMIESRKTFLMSKRNTYKMRLATSEPATAP